MQPGVAQARAGRTFWIFAFSSSCCKICRFTSSRFSRKSPMPVSATRTRWARTSTARGFRTTRRVQIDCRNRRQRREHAGVRSPQARHTHAHTPVRDHAMYAHRKPSVARRRTSPKRFTPGVRTGTGGRTQSGHTYISQARCCSSAAWCPAWPWCRIRTRNTQYTGDEARVTIGAAGGEGLRVGCARRCKRSRRASRRRGGRPFFSPLEE